MGRYKSALMAETDAKAFACHVDVPVPPDGLGRRIDVFTAWLEAHLGSDWRCHGQMVGGRHMSRYMFRSAGDAALFENALSSGELDTIPRP